MKRRDYAAHLMGLKHQTSLLSLIFYLQTTQYSESARSFTGIRNSHFDRFTQENLQVTKQVGDVFSQYLANYEQDINSSKNILGHCLNNYQDSHDQMLVLNLATNQNTSLRESLELEQDIANNDLISLAQKFMQITHENYDGSMIWKIPRFGFHLGKPVSIDCRLCCCILSDQERIENACI